MHLPGIIETFHGHLVARSCHGWQQNIGYGGSCHSYRNNIARVGQYKHCFRVSCHSWLQKGDIGYRTTSAFVQLLKCFTIFSPYAFQALAILSYHGGRRWPPELSMAPCDLTWCDALCTPWAVRPCQCVVSWYTY